MKKKFMLLGAVAFCAAMYVAGSVSAQDKPNVTYIESEGNLAGKQDLTGITLADVTSEMLPPDLFAASRNHLDNGNLYECGSLFLVAQAFARFDTYRVTDRTAHQGLQVLVQTHFMDKFDEMKDMMELMTTRVKDGSGYCDSLRSVGPPTYEPWYMVNHGIKSMSGSEEEPFIKTGYDSLWNETVNNYINCGK